MTSPTGNAPQTVRLWSLTEDALVEDGPEPGAVTVLGRWGEVAFDGLDVRTEQSLRRMALGPVTLRNVADAEDGSGREVAAGIEEVLDRLGGTVVHSLAGPDGRVLLSVVPDGLAPVFRAEPLPPDARVALSRFATLRAGDGALLLEVPSSGFHALLVTPEVRAVVTSMATPTELSRIAPPPDVPAALVRDVASFLAAAGLIEVDRPADEPEDGWSHHERLFHERTRNLLVRPASEPRSPGAVVPTPPAVTAPVPPGRRVRLPVPGPDARHDPTLSALLEVDLDCPHSSDTDVTTAQVGELLYRSARVRSVGPAAVPALADVVVGESSQRPYFSIARLYELEIHLIVDRCEDLPRGRYHYDPLDHALTLLEGDAELADARLERARVCAALERRPGVLVTVSARLRRSWPVFGGSAYAVALTHCGHLQQVLRLNGLALGLSVHALPPVADDAAGSARTDVERAEAEIGMCVLQPIS